MRIVLLGPPGAGKGTQASSLASEFGAVHLATGDMLRLEIQAGTELGMQAKSFMDRGDLVPDDVIIGMIKGRLRDASGMILDGFPRTVTQAEALDAELARLGAPLDAAINLKVDRDELVRRLSSRAICVKCSKPFTLDQPGAGKTVRCDDRADCDGEYLVREDDRPEAVVRRLKVYEEQTLPVVGYYQGVGLLVEVDGEGSTSEVNARLVEAAVSASGL